MLPLKLKAILFVTAISTSFQFGFHTGVINAPYQLISDFIGNVTADRHGSADEAYVTVIASVCVSGFLIGGLAGALISGLLANKLGRKRAILVLSGPCVLGCIFIMVCQAARSFEIIIVGRLLVGVACGAYTAVGPLYMSEIVPLSVRGAAGVLNQLMIVFSLLLSQILGLQQIMGTKDLWPYLLGLNVIPCILGSALLLLCPESPRYLYIIKRDPETARAALQRLRSPDHDIDTELAGFSREASIASRKATIFELLRKPYLRIGLMVALLAQFGQQLSGINGVIYYSVELFKVNGLTDEQATYTTIGIGGFMLLITVVSIFIIDRVGRRILLIGGLAVAFLSLLSFTFCMIGKQYGQVNWPIYPAIVSIYVFVCGFGIGPGSIPWFIAAEMFSQETRDAAMGVSATTNWLCNIAVALGFIQMIKYLEFYSFLPSACILLVVIVLLYIYMPETKGKSADMIEAEFRRRTNLCHRDSYDSEFAASSTSVIQAVLGPDPAESEIRPLLR
nr:glucose transporter 3 [Clonorchis sinensis]